MKILKIQPDVGSVIMAIDNDVKVRVHCHNTEKYRGSAHSDFNINVKLNHKVFVVFYNLKNYDSHLIRQEIGKFNLKINFIPYVLESNKSGLIDSFQFLSSSLDLASLKT